MYYFLVVISVVMFGGCFALNDCYRKLRSSSIKSSLESSFIGSLAGLVMLFLISGFKFEATPFTIIMATFAALIGIAFLFCSFKALDSANLSLYSLFSMLGGMVLPFFQGILFYGEKFTVAKLCCVLFIIGSLMLTVNFKKSKNGLPYYIGVFVLNGMSGVLSKIFTSSGYAKTSADWYSIWIAILTAVISGVLLLFYKKDKCGDQLIKAVSISSINGILNRVANFLLVVALVHIDASVQYPLITGGVIIVSTIVSLFSKNKPTKKELVSVALSFIGLVLLFVL